VCTFAFADISYQNLVSLFQKRSLILEKERMTVSESVQVVHQTASSTTSDGEVAGPRTRTASEQSSLFAMMLHHDDLVTKRNSAAWVVAVSILERNPGRETVRNLLNEQLVKKFFRFRSTLTLNEKSEGIFHEVSVDDMDWDYHVPDLSQSTKGYTREQVYKFVSDLNEQKYDLSKPLFRYFLIPSMENGEAAIVSSINHAIGDGLALVAVTDGLHGLVEQPAAGTSLSVKHQGKKPVVNKLDYLSQLGIMLYGVFFAITLPLAKPDPPNPLRMPKGQKPLGQKRLAMAAPLSLDRVKEIKNKLPGTTINDVLMALMTMTLKAYFLDVGAYRKNDRVTAQFPYSMRDVGEGGLDKTGEPHNRVSYAYFNFDLLSKDRISTIWNTKHQIDVIKVSPAPLVVSWNVRLALRLFSKNTMMDLAAEGANFGTAQLSNVPAPQGQVTFAGVKILDMGFFLFSPLACYLGILTYNNIVNAAFNLDSGLNVDPKDLAKHWNDEFEALYKDVMEKAGDGVIAEPPHDTSSYQKIGRNFLAFIGFILFYVMFLRR